MVCPTRTGRSPQPSRTERARVVGLGSPLPLRHGGLRGAPRVYNYKTTTLYKRSPERKGCALRTRTKESCGRCVMQAAHVIMLMRYMDARRDRETRRDERSRSHVPGLTRAVIRLSTQAFHPGFMLICNGVVAYWSPFGNLVFRDTADRARCISDS